MPAALATSSGLPVTKPRAKLATLLEGFAASRSADSTFAFRAGATGTSRSAASARKLLRQLDVARRERLIDLARRHGGVEVAVELQFRQLHRIVGGRDLARRIDAAGQAHGRRERKAQRDRKRKGDGKAR